MKERESKIFIYLVTNKDFRDWVVNPTEERSYFWKKWMDEHPEASGEVKRAWEFIERMNFKKEQLSFGEMDELLGKIIANEKPPFKASAKQEFFQAIGWLMKVAAVLIVCFLFILLIDDFASRVQVKPQVAAVEWKTVENPKGERSEINLPDGSVVHLNAESRLRYPAVFGVDQRKVELTGEAFFEVAHNDSVPFLVETYGIETEVLGTTFNVRAYAEDLTTQVSLVSGRVKVNEKGGVPEQESIVLAPGEQLSYNRNSRAIVKSPFNVEQTTGWKDGIIYFEDAGLEEFVDQIESWYGVDFQIYGTTSKEWRINGRYQHEELDNILTGLKFVYGIEYRIDGKNVTLKLK